jgi:hypothetical protein
MKASLTPLWDDPEVDHLLAEAEEELRRLSPAQRRELFGTEFLPPSPEEFLPVNLEEEDEVPFLF